MIALADALAAPLEAGIFLLSQTLGGSLPGGLLAMSLLVRLALFPLTYRLARRARRRVRELRELAPALDGIRRRWADDPRRLGEATLALYRKHGVAAFEPAPVVGAVIQLPIHASVYRAVRAVLPSLRGQGFLWIRDLARPSPLLALVVGALVFAAAALTAPAQGDHPSWLRVLPAVAVGGFLLFTSSGFGLHLLASTGVSTVQSGLLHRAEQRAERA